MHPLASSATDLVAAVRSGDLTAVACTEAFLDLLAIRKAQMFSDVCLQRSHKLLCLRVLPYSLGNHRVLHKASMCSDMRLMVLINKRFDRLANQHIHVFRHGVCGFLVILDGDQLVSVLNP